MKKYMNNQSLGRLNKAPLAYVLAQVRFQNIPDLEKHIPSIHAALRNILPRSQKIPQAVLQTNGSISEVVPLLLGRWEFASTDNKKGVVIQNNSLVYHVTEYNTYADFHDELMYIIKVVSDIIPNILVDRLGVRYIDFIVPENGESPEKYIIDGLRCKPELGIDNLNYYGFSVFQYQLDEGIMVARLARAKGAPRLPEDLQGMNLAPSDIMTAQIEDNIETAFLDTDRFVEDVFEFEIERVSTLFTKMHKDISTFFKKITTPFAMDKWNGK